MRIVKASNLYILHIQVLSTIPAAFTLEIDNTLGFQNFNLSFVAHMMDVEDRTTTWQVRWGSGASPTTFTNLGTVSVGTTFGATANGPITIGSVFDNSPTKKWIQIVTLTNSSGSNNRDTFGIDDFVLTYSVVAVPEPASLLLVSLAGLFSVVRRNKR